MAGVRYREILRLHAKGVSQRSIAASVGCAKSTVQDVLRAAGAAGVEWPLPEEMGDAAICAAIYPARDRSDASKAPIDHKWVEREMLRRGVTMSLLWDEYARSAADAGPGPYTCSAFCDRHRRWREANPEVTMHMEWRPGEWTQVDWAGDTMSVADPDAGRPRRVYVFVGALPLGEHACAEGFYSMGIGPWVEAHVHMFAFFGGTTPLLAPDNLKVGVTRNDADGLVLNEQYRRMCEHYGVAVVPARVRRPRDKAGVEMEVGLVERQVVAPPGDRTFLSLADPDQALWEGVARPDARPSRRREGSRESTFLGQEKPCLQPLPPEPYEMAARTRATVQFNYHVLFDGGTARCPRGWRGGRWRSPPRAPRWPQAAAASAWRSTSAPTAPGAPTSPTRRTCPGLTGSTRAGAATTSAAGRTA